MLFLGFLALAVLSVYFLPVAFLPRKASARAEDYFVSSERPPPNVIQNSSIAYALKMATFGPFFTWGATADFWPAIISSISLGMGVLLLYALRAPMLAFFRDGLENDRSITVNGFIAGRHGGDPRVRLLAAGFTVFALSGLILCEAFGLAALLKPMLPETSNALIILGLLALTAAFTLPAGQSGVLRSTQAQLGMLYLGLFGSTALLLYIFMATLGPSSPKHGTLAVLLVAACCIVILSYRRSRYVDTSPLDMTDAAAPPGAPAGREPFGLRLFRRFNKILNVLVSVLAVFVVVFAGMELYPRGAGKVLSEGAAALQSGTAIPAMGLIALVLLPLFYPVVDVTNWQRFAALAKDASAPSVGSNGWTAAFGSIVRTYAVESALVSLFMCMFGAIATIALRTPGGAHVMEAFVQRLAAQQNWVAAGALSFLLLCILMIALSTMSAMFSASLSVFHCDILPEFRREPAPQQTSPGAERMAIRGAVTAGGGLCLLMFFVFSAADASFTIDFSGAGFLALVVTFCCTQLSLAPLVIGPLIGRTSGSSGVVSAQGALTILAVSAAVGLGAVAAYVATGNQLWLWAAAPACLGSGFLIFAIARLRAPKAA